MKNKLLLSFVLVASLAAAQNAAKSETVVSAPARKIQDAAIVVDTHADTPQRFLDENFDIGSIDPNDAGHIELDGVCPGVGVGILNCRTQ